MTKLKVAVIYYSSTGANYQMAKWAADGAEKEGAEVRLVKIRELAPREAIESNDAWKANVENTRDVPEASIDDLDWADAYIFSVPTRYGNMPSQVQQFIDTTGGLWFQGRLVNKVVTAMTSAQNPHGGQESTLLTIYKTMHHWGAIVVTPAYADPVTFESGGNPYGTSVTVGPDGKMKENKEKAVHFQAKRLVNVASALKKGWEN